MKIDNMLRNEMLKIVGGELTAQDFQSLCNILEGSRVFFDDNARIAIQRKHEEVTKGIRSGSQFGDWLNTFLSSQLEIKL